MGMTSEEQEAAELERQKGLARERVARREKLGHQAVPEPLLDDED